MNIDQNITFPNYKYIYVQWINNYRFIRSLIITLMFNLILRFKTDKYIGAQLSMELK